MTATASVPQPTTTTAAATTTTSAEGSIVADTFRPVPLAAVATLTHTESWRHIFQPAGPHTGTAVWSFAGTRYEATASFHLT